MFAVRRTVSPITGIAMIGAAIFCLGCSPPPPDDWGGATRVHEGLTKQHVVDLMGMPDEEADPGMSGDDYVDKECQGRPAERIWIYEGRLQENYNRTYRMYVYFDEGGNVTCVKKIATIIET